MHIFDVKTNVSQQINLGNYQDFYIPRIEWTSDAKTLSVQVMNRHQNNLDLHFVDGTTGTTKIVLSEKDNAYIDVTDNLTFLKDNSFIAFASHKASSSYTQSSICLILVTLSDCLVHASE